MLDEERLACTDRTSGREGWWGLGQVKTQPGGSLLWGGGIFSMLPQGKAEGSPDPGVWPWWHTGR